MPELPEVEWYTRRLVRLVQGRTIVHVHLPDPEIVSGGRVSDLVGALRGKKILNIRRHGKAVVLHLGESCLLIHLRMSGKFVTEDPRLTPPKFLRIALMTDGESHLSLCDPRRLSRVHWIQSPDAATHPFIASLGPDPTSAGFSGRVLMSRCGRGRRIKEVLMDQKVLAGIGNIQAAEALHLARVDPRRRVGELASEDFQKILDAIRRSIAETLELEHGSTITYVQEDPGQSKFRVYGRAGKPCLECGSLLQTYKIAGRSTVSCPRCQS